jgi:hypothetical protein
MKKLRQITEIMDSHYPYTEEPDYKNTTRQSIYNFKTEKGTHYKCFIDSYDNKDAELEFNNRSSTKSSIGNTGVEAYTSHKVFGTMKKIAHYHLQKYPHFKTVSFSSIKNNPRKKLYHHFAKSIDPNYKTIENNHDILFTVKNPYHKGEA